jgi:hypothetical protein
VNRPLQVVGIATSVLAAPIMVLSMGIMAMKIGQLALSPSAGRLFGPVVIILQQRLRLGAFSIDITEYY